MKVPQTRTTFTTLFIMIISVTVISGHVLVGHIHELTKGVTMNVRQFTLSCYSVVGWYSIQLYFANLSYTNFFEKLEKSKDFQPITHAMHASLSRDNNEWANPWAIANCNS